MKHKLSKMEKDNADLKNKNKTLTEQLGSGGENEIKNKDLIRQLEF